MGKIISKRGASRRFTPQNLQKSLPFGKAIRWLNSDIRPRAADEFVRVSGSREDREGDEEIQASSTSLANLTFSAWANRTSLSSEIFSRPRSISER